MKFKSKLKEQRGSITLYVFTSMVFFTVVVVGLYVNSNNKLKKQEDEIDRIQRMYTRTDIDDLYEEVHYKYISSITPTITVKSTDGKTTYGVITGEGENSTVTVEIPSSVSSVRLYLSNSSNLSVDYAYKQTRDATTSTEVASGSFITGTVGQRYYVYIKFGDKTLSTNYTAVSLVKKTT